ncbi:MAG: hypothetical protein R2710_25635 [Acidimicrobiales bacterium]
MPPRSACPADEPADSTRGESAFARAFAAKGEIAEALQRIEHTADLGDDQPWKRHESPSPD